VVFIGEEVEGSWSRSRFLFGVEWFRGLENTGEAARVSNEDMVP